MVRPSRQHGAVDNHATNYAVSGRLASCWISFPSDKCNNSATISIPVISKSKTKKDFNLFVQSLHFLLSKVQILRSVKQTHECSQCHVARPRIEFTPTQLREKKLLAKCNHCVKLAIAHWQRKPHESCSICGTQKPRGEFSNTQLGKPIKKCKMCASMSKKTTQFQATVRKKK